MRPALRSRQLSGDDVTCADVINISGPWQAALEHTDFMISSEADKNKAHILSTSTSNLNDMVVLSYAYFRANKQSLHRTLFATSHFIGVEISQLCLLRTFLYSNKMQQLAVQH